jgi:hypothetical protein
MLKLPSTFVSVKVTIYSEFKLNTASDRTISYVKWPSNFRNSSPLALASQPPHPQLSIDRIPSHRDHENLTDIEITGRGTDLVELEKRVMATDALTRQTKEEDNK